MNNILDICCTIPIFKILKKINYYTNSWGLSIIILTIIIKIIIYPLNKLQYISILKFNYFKSEIDKINNECKDKDIKNNNLIMLYKKEKINPIYGIILVFIQMPIFFALYNIFTKYTELKNVSFLWINDLSYIDQYYILPILIGISTFLIQINFSKNNIFDIMSIIIPIMFSFLSIYIPSGLIIYYLLNNIITFIQQVIIYKNFMYLKT